jgi:predicted DNA-binding antitoxin AbrB/MazE fold protein
MTVRAVYENGVFRPTEPVDLPEGSVVDFDIWIKVRLSDEEQWAAQKRINELMLMSMPSGETDVAERHNEHQP